MMGSRRYELDFLPLLLGRAPPSNADVQGPMPGLLLVYPFREVEEEFRHHQSASHYWHDVLWSLCSIAIVIRGCCVRTEGGWQLCATEVALSTLLLALQLGQRASYLRNRPRILAATRVARLAAILALFLPSATAEDDVWPLLPNAASCTASMLLSQLHKITCIVSRSLALPVPLKHSLGIQALSLGVMLAFVPRRCASYLDSTASQDLDLESCALGAADQLRALERSSAWVINLALAEAPVALETTPLAACVAVQAVLIAVVGFLGPLLLQSSLEEHRRLQWAELTWWGTSLRPPLAIRLAYDAVFMFMGALIAAQAAQIFPWHLL